MWRPRNNVATASVALLALVVFGTAGYKMIEGWEWFECFYMTIITLATIGYKEPDGISIYGRYWTAALIVGGVGTVGYAVSVLAQSAVQGELLSTWERRRVQERMKRLENHFIICGYGRVGKLVAEGLASEGVEFVIVELDRMRVDALPEKDWYVVLGDATHEDVLRRAGIEHARGLVAALATDPENVFVCLTARDISESLMIVARVNNETAVAKMRKAGANKIISPLATGAHQILQALLRPTVAQFIELATMAEGLDLVIEEVLVGLGAPIAGKMLRETNIRRDLNVIIVAIKRAQGEMIFNPNAETIVSSGDKIIAIGSRTGVDGLAMLSQGQPATAN